MAAKPPWSRPENGPVLGRNDGPDRPEFERFRFPGLGAPKGSKTCNALGCPLLSFFKHGLNRFLGALALDRYPDSRIWAGMAHPGPRIRSWRGSLNKTPDMRSGRCMSALVI